MVTTIAVRCDGTRDEGWVCAVTLGEGAREISTHRVLVAGSDVERLAPGTDSATALVQASFEFLLERESPQAILRSFDLTEIGRYFPEYEVDIRRRVRPS
jgi:hypothetical protein